MSGTGSWYWDLVISLISKGIVSPEQWFHVDRAAYVCYGKRRRDRLDMKQLFRDVRRHMCWTKRVGDYLTDRNLEGLSMSDNPVFRILARCGYDPAFVGSVILAWAFRENGTRNTLWLRGPPESGAPYLAEALAYSSPLVTCVDWRNRSNPFDRGMETLLFWWDGGHVPEASVGFCMQVFRGESVMMPRGEDGRLVELPRTPVLVYSRHDMSRVMVRWGQYTDDYADAIRASMYCLRFEPCEEGEGISGVTCEDVRAFLTWALPRRLPVPPDVFDLKCD